MGDTTWALMRDHSVRGQAVLPGSAFISAAMSSVPVAFYEIGFEAMCPIADSPPLLRVDTTGDELRIVHEATGAVHARMRRGDVEPIREVPSVTAPREPQAGSDLYKTLAGSGNEYGPAFQGIVSSATTGNQVVAEWRLPAGWPPDQAVIPLLDACTHALAAADGQSPSTFVLTGCDQLTLLRSELTAARLIASVSASDASGTMGDVTIVNEDGASVGLMSGLRLVRLDGDDAPDHRITVAATFTADPLVDVVDLWAHELGVSLGATIAPYGQVFQQLLDPRSDFSDATTGLNVTLLKLDDWSGGTVPTRRESIPAAMPEPDMATRQLPNGHTVAHLNDYETDYLYREIFLDRAYGNHGVTVRDGDVVVDIGANIGLFSLWAHHEADNVTSYAFEPSPVVLPVLRANLAAIDGARVVAAGVADAEGEAEFTCYPRSSVFSGFAADESRDRDALGAIIANMVAGATDASSNIVSAIVDDLLADRLDATAYRCRLVGLSEQIRALDIERIDLLKIDAEGSELAVLAGIEDEHWDRIAQVVIEVHGSDEVAGVVERLADLGFEITAVEEEELLSGSGLFNVHAVRPERGSSSNGRLASTVDEFCDALRHHRSAVPHLVVLCPPAIEAHDLGRLSAQIAATVQDLDATYLLDGQDLAGRYDVADVHDAIGASAGHVPYTTEWFAALGTELVRMWRCLHQPPAKIIALDADNTLWKGEVGELGIDGIEATPGHLSLQRFVVEQIAAGLLAVIVSKNDEEDVLAALDGRDDFPLSARHLVSHRIGWADKSASLGELADELGLGLDSFVFVDDNPVECAEVAAACPSVTVLPIPADDVSIGRFLDRAWVFDRIGATTDDTNRTERYRDEVVRKRERTAAPTMADFLAGLGLEVALRPAEPRDLERASQLTFRTNQFNLTGIRHSTAELAGKQADLVEAKDRFGDYGIVGLVVAEPNGSTLAVETFLLSCRVLGRGVEHRVLALIGEQAIAKGLDEISLPFITTDRNEPARRFLAEVGREIPANQAVTARYEPTDGQQTDEVHEAANDRSTSAAPLDANRIATEYATAADIAAAIGARRITHRPDLDVTFAAPRGEAEADLAAIWSSAIGVDRVGRHDPFFELGGTSLMGVDVVARLHRELGVEISIVDLFEHATVAALASAIEGPSAEGADAGRSRGQARRQRRPTRRNRS